VESSCELGNEPSGSIKCWESTEWLHNLWPLEQHSAPQGWLVSCVVFTFITGSKVVALSDRKGISVVPVISYAPVINLPDWINSQYT
jgi:hypothetical protein